VGAGVTGAVVVGLVITPLSTFVLGEVVGAVVSGIVLLGEVVVSFGTTVLGDVVLSGGTVVLGEVVVSFGTVVLGVVTWSFCGTSVSGWVVVSGTVWSGWTDSSSGVFGLSAGGVVSGVVAGAWVVLEFGLKLGSGVWPHARLATVSVENSASVASTFAFIASLLHPFPRSRTPTRRPWVARLASRVPEPPAK
jgi:hypothetical protein